MYKNILRSTLLASTVFLIACQEEQKATTTETTPAPTTTEVPTTTPAITTSPANEEATPASAATPAGTPPKLNPPHGQPFHKCEIPVGAPLDGSAAAPGTTAAAPASEPKSFFKAAQATEQTAPQTPPNVQQVTPQTNQTATADVGTKPKLNPAHGQPFHRCDIAVGAPLP